MRDDHGPADARGMSCHFNPRPSHEGRQDIKCNLTLEVLISIHVPRMRDDFSGATTGTRDLYFNPRPSHEGRPSSYGFGAGKADFNPRPSHEGRRHPKRLFQSLFFISIHVPRMRDDLLQMK